MRLGIVTHMVTKGDGQGRVNYETAWEALRRGHHVTLLASEVSPDLRAHPQVCWVAIPVQGVPSTLLSNLVFSMRSAAWLKRHRQDLDVVQVNGAITSVKAEVNAVHFVHSSWLRSPVHPCRQQRNLYGLYQWLYTHLNAIWERQAFQKAQQLVAVSEKVKQELADIGVPKERIQVIFNGVDLTEFSPGWRDRSLWNLPHNVPLALFVGDIRTNRKNLDSVLQAMTQVPALHLAIAGSTQGSPYPDLAAQLGLQARVHFLGFRQDIADLMQAVDFFVFPSRYEACTLVLLEAMAAGLPVVTTLSAGGSEIITPACGVVLSDSEDVTLLATVLNQLQTDPTARTQMGKSARTLAENFSWHNTATQYVDLFEHLNGQKSH